LTLPDPSTLSLPVNAATGVTTTTPFSWTPLTSSIYAVLINGPANQPDYLVITGSNSCTIPDLTTLGLGLPQGIAYSWSVLTFGPFANIDAAAGTSGFVPKGDATETISAQRTFTTAP
jgi:hypothetical protein